MSPEDHAITTSRLEKSFGDVTAIDGLSLTIPRGELFGVLGPNGAGKSTTINVLTGQLEPDDGRARVLGVDPVANPIEVRERVGILPERGRTPSFLTVDGYFDFVAKARGLDADYVDARVDEWADRLDFAEKRQTYTTDLSQGEQQKVLITQAFLHEPALVFIDEPLTNLDPIVQERVKRYLRDYVDAGNTVLLSTHFVDTAEELCTEVGILKQGRLAATVAPRHLGDDESLLDHFVTEVTVAGRTEADASEIPTERTGHEAPGSDATR